MSNYTFLALALLFSTFVGTLNQKQRWLTTPVLLTLLGALLSGIFWAFQAQNVAAPLCWIQRQLQQLHVAPFILKGLLGVLLFAGALQLPLRGLLKERRPVLIFALLGTAAATLLNAAVLFLISVLFHYACPIGYCLLFGAIIASTDPVAAFTLLRHTGLPKSMLLQLVSLSLTMG